MIISQICADMLHSQQQLHTIGCMQRARSNGTWPADAFAAAKLAAAAVGQQQFIKVCQSLLARAGAANDCAMAPEVA